MGGGSPMLGGGFTAAPPTSSGGLDFLGGFGASTLQSSQPKEVLFSIIRCLIVLMRCFSICSFG